ncbi:MAG: alpha-amylase family glycosyl hydrolase [Flavobacteriales bacterium]
MLNRILLVLSFCVAIGTFSQTPTVLDLPAGSQEGFVQTGPETAVFTLFVPNIPYVYLKGDFTGWNNSLMNITPDGNYHWKELQGLSSGQEYRYQYVVGENAVESADPYSEKILDPWNDQFISDQVYPGLIDYPQQANYSVSAFRMNAPEFVWGDEGFTAPARNKLNIYELLVRDFTDERSYQGVLDRLDYLENLGINAIELMPCAEFDGNESWGYSTNFFMAPDKYYGPKRKLQELINECHQRGIAVIMDVVYNHSFGLNPQVRIYNDAADGFGAVSSNNPWLNTIATHPFNVGTDYNHESGNTRKFVKDAMSYWLQEFHLDGFRFDLSKGFTQNNSLGNVGAWNQYDQSRVNILNDYASHVWSSHPDTYLILEHLSDNPEEQALAGAGFLIWGGMHTDFKNAAMGYGSNLEYASYQNRGYAFANLINYMVSHDEERLMYECLNFGNNFNGYNITDEATALKRMELVHTFFLSIPGPKMMWMFDELGYDLSINDCGNGTNSEDCRTANKPVLWNYAEEPGRVSLYKTIKALNYIRNNHEVIHTSNFNIAGDGFQKRINLYGSDMNMVVIGNFDVVTGFMSPNFSQTGTWYNYMTGESFEVSNTNETWTLAPGEFYILTDQQLPTPDLDGSTSIFSTEGCTDPDAVNYDVAAEGDDGSCQYQLTFRVGTQGLTVAPSGINIAGSFQGWDPASTVMTEVSPDVWEHSITVNSSQTVSFKYINGNDWPQSETVPEECGVSDGFGGFNRSLVTAAGDEVIPVHCLSSCALCASPDVDVTFRVDMTNEMVSADGVRVTGNFLSEAGETADWLPAGLLLADDNEDQVYELTVQLQGNFEYQYKILNGIGFEFQEASTNLSECGISDGFDGFNRTVEVEFENVVTETFCFEECIACSEVSDGMVDVTFRVDMFNEEISASGVHLAGNFQGWDPSATAMINTSASLWELTVSVPENLVIEYKFINGTAWGEDELIPIECAQNNNRFFNLGMEDVVLDLVCFRECQACAGCTNELATNYNPNANTDNGSCEISPENYCGDCTIWDEASQACIQNPECTAKCPGDINNDGVVTVGDLSGFLAAFGTVCE